MPPDTRNGQKCGGHRAAVKRAPERQTTPRICGAAGVRQSSKFATGGRSLTPAAKVWRLAGAVSALKAVGPQERKAGVALEAGCALESQGHSASGLGTRRMALLPWADGLRSSQTAPGDGEREPGSHTLFSGMSRAGAGRSISLIGEKWDLILNVLSLLLLLKVEPLQG